MCNTKRSFETCGNKISCSVVPLSLSLAKYILRHSMSLLGIIYKFQYCSELHEMNFPASLLSEFSYKVFAPTISHFISTTTHLCATAIAATSAFPSFSSRSLAHSHQHRRGSLTWPMVSHCRVPGRPKIREGRGLAVRNERRQLTAEKWSSIVRDQK